MKAISVLSAALVAVSLLGAGCASQSEAPVRSVKTSYPSPDYPPETAEQAPPAPAPQPAPSSAPVGRPLYGPVGQPAASAASPAASQPMSGPAGMGRGPGLGHGPGGAGAPNMSRLFDAMDTDHNGRVTLEEWRAFHEREFRRLDKNNDGVLTRDEMAAPPPMHPGGGARPAP